MIKKKRKPQKPSGIPRGARQEITKLGYTKGQVDNHIYGKCLNNDIQKEINKILRRKKK